jgi:hypothetical protein
MLRSWRKKQIYGEGLNLRIREPTRSNGIAATESVYDLRSVLACGQHVGFDRLCPADPWGRGDAYRSLRNGCRRLNWLPIGVFATVSR